MSAVDDILAQVPMGDLAAQLGVDEPTAEAAARQAIPALLGGLHANAQDPSGAASLAGALGDHSADLLDGGVDLGGLDTADGAKIVQNIFGPHTDQVAQTLGAGLGGGAAGLGGAAQGDLMKKLLPILAPIVLSYLAKRLQGSKYGNILGPLLAGAAGGSAGGALGEILGGLLGGGSPSGGSGAHGSVIDILGGLLGAGRR